MIYLLYHLVTGTEMGVNGLPRWIDVAAGLIDGLIVAALILLVGGAFYS